MITIILSTLIINASIYIWQYVVWLKDCEEIGEDNLAVSLGERMRATMFCITIPCILGILLHR